MIVVGVLIAISFEQSAEAWHWHEQVEEARTAIHTELKEADDHYAFVVATKDCVDGRLALLDGIIENVAAGRHVAPVGLVGMHLGDALDDSVWEAQRSAQTLVHFPKDDCISSACSTRYRPICAIAATCRSLARTPSAAPFTTL